MELDQNIQQFQKWAEKSVKESSAKNYATTVRGFYRNADREEKIKLNAEDKYIEKISNDIANHITSESMKYGMKKYLDWLSLKAPDIESERTAEFLKKKIDKVPIENTKEDVENKVISADTLTQVCKKAGQKQGELGLMFRMMYETGARFSGMNRLLWRDVERTEFSGEQLKPHQVFISKKRSKGKIDGVVEISDTTLQDLNEIKEERNPGQDEQVFFPDLTNPSTYQKAWRFFDDNWPEYSTHYFRHSRLTHLGLQMYDEENLDYSSIKERLRRYARHKSSDTTEIYIEIVKNKLAQKNNNMEKYRTVDWQ